MVIGLLVAVLIALGPSVVTPAEQRSEGGGAALDERGEPYLPTIDFLGGKLTIVGSETMQQLMSSFGSELKKWYPRLHVMVETEGSVAGFEQFMEWSATGHAVRGDQPPDVRGDVPSALILASTNPPTEDQVKAFAARSGSLPLELQIGFGAVGIYVHENNPLRELTLEQVDAIFGRSRKRGTAADISRWGQIGLHGEWEDKPLHLYGRDSQSGTRSFLKAEALLGGDFKPTIKEEPGLESMILSISKDPLGIGYGGGLSRQYSFVRVLALSEKPGRPSQLPNADSVRQHTYPLSRKLLLYATQPVHQAINPLVREFLRFAHSREGQDLIDHSGFYRISSAQITQNLEILGLRSKAR
jgi:phosphate transport system substrate-binding protein